MCEMFATTKLAMAMAEERTREKRESITLAHFNLGQYLRPIVRSLLSFLF